MNSFFNIKKGERAAECGAKRAKNKTSTPSLRGGGMGVGVKNIKPTLFFLSILLIIYFLIAGHNNADWDLWARLAVGKIFFTTGHILKQDIFAYTQTKPIWIDHEWLSGVVFYYLVDKFGDLGLSLLKAVLMFSVFFSIFKLNQLKFPEQNHYRIIYYAFFLYAILFGFLTTVQSHCFTFAFFALWMYLFELIKRGNNRLIWIFPATMVLWANLHGGFFAGLGLVFLYTIGEAINRRKFAKYIVILGVSTLATLINPYGIKYLPYLIEAVTMKRPFLTEWMPLNLFGSFSVAFGFKIFALFTLFSLLYVLMKRQKEINWSEILILCATFWVSLQHIMHNIFFIIAAAGYITGYLHQAFDFCTTVIARRVADSTRQSKLLNRLLRQCFAPPRNDTSSKIKTGIKSLTDFIIYSLIILIGTLTIHFVPLKVKVDNKQFPVRAVKFIQQNNLSGNLLVLFNWGSYALWQLHPQCLVAVDGRYDGVYPESLISEVARFHYVGKNWNELMTKYHTDIILMNTDYAVYNKLIMLDDWRVVYKDDTSAVFIPITKNREHWIMPDEKFDINNQKFKTRILN